MNNILKTKCIIDGKDIFRRLIIHFFTTSTPLTRQDKFYSKCSLCGDNEKGVCSGCVQILTNLSQQQTKEIYLHLKEIGDKKRANKLATHFCVHPQDKPITKIHSPTKNNPNKLAIVDIVGIRKKHKLTQSKMAKKLGISVKALSLGETGKRPLPAKTKDIYVLLDTRV